MKPIETSSAISLGGTETGEISDDELFKRYFQEGGGPPFLRTFWAPAAALWDFSSLRFRDKELLGPSLDDPVRRVDLLGEIASLAGGPLTTLHFEVEHTWRFKTRYRGVRYDSRLIGPKEGPLLTAVLYLRGGKRGIYWETVVHPGPEQPPIRYTRKAICFRRLFAPTYLTPECEPEIAALCAWTNPKPWSRPELKAMALSRVVLVSDEEWRTLLMKMVETGLKLRESEEQEFRRIVGRTREYGEVNEMLTVYEAKGREVGLQQGKGEMLLRVLRLKFGELPEAVTDRVRSLSGAAEIEAWMDRVVPASTLEEVGLVNGAH